MGHALEGSSDGYSPHHIEQEAERTWRIAKATPGDDSACWAPLLHAQKQPHNNKSWGTALKA